MPYGYGKFVQVIKGILHQEEILDVLYSTHVCRICNQVEIIHANCAIFFHMDLQNFETTALNL